MIGNALIVTIAILLALGFWLMGELKFLIPYRQVLLDRYAGTILVSIGVLFVNLFALIYVIQRKFFLKDTGRKLSHIDKQAITGESSIPAPRLPEESK
jgi:cytochrome c biogenesis protein CcdA